MTLHYLTLMALCLALTPLHFSPPPLLPPSLQWSLDMLDDWIQFGVKGEARDYWGVQLSKDLTVSR